jgi:hypothetical protein
VQVACKSSHKSYPEMPTEFVIFIFCLILTELTCRPLGTKGLPLVQGPSDFFLISTQIKQWGLNVWLVYLC